MKFDRISRITSRNDFLNVKKKGSSIYGKYLKLGYLEDSNLKDSFKIGIITTKYIGNSVNRSKIRCKLRGIRNRIYIMFKKNYFFVIIPNKLSCKATSFDLEKDLIKMLKLI